MEHINDQKAVNTHHKLLEYEVESCPFGIESYVTHKEWDDKPVCFVSSREEALRLKTLLNQVDSLIEQILDEDSGEEFIEDLMWRKLNSTKLI